MEGKNSRFDRAMQLLDAQAHQGVPGPSNISLSMGSVSGVAKRKRIQPPPPQLDPNGQYSQPSNYEDANDTKRARSSLPGSIEEDEEDEDYNSDDDDELPAGAAHLGLKGLSHEAQLLLLNGRPDLNGEDQRRLDIDDGGPDQAAAMARFLADPIGEFGKIASVQEAAANLGLASYNDLIPGLDARLLPHQCIGVSWMLNKERNPREMGGILADDMGLGKTVQAIALMCVNPPDFEAEDQRAERRKLTLIIAPAALLDQWKDEIETKSDLFKVFVHHGVNKAKNVAHLRKYDVVITSYHTMLADLQPRRNKETKGPIGETLWYRIILDEAQIIRNRLAQISQATARLDARYHWSLSGTPFTNGLSDLYPLLRFARLRPWNDWETFKEHIGGVKPNKTANTATAKMSVIVMKHLLRRRKDDKLDGKPILTLKPKNIDIELVDFSPEERRIYDAVEKQQKLTISRFHKAGTLYKNYQYVLVMILRLRQVCCHPQLIAYAADEIAHPDAERVLGEAYENDDTEATIRTIKQASAIMDPELVKKLQQKYKSQALAKLEREILDGDDDDSGDVEPGEECPICYEEFSIEPRITVCGHRFCRDCIEGIFQAQIEYHDDNGGAATRPCPNCRRNIQIDQLINARLFEPSPAEIQAMRKDFEKEKKAKEKRMKMDYDLSMEDSDIEELPNPDDWWMAKKPVVKKESKGSSKGKEKVVPKEKKEKKSKKSKMRLDDSGSEDFGSDDFIDRSQKGSRVSKAQKKKPSKARSYSLIDDSSDANSMESSESDSESEDEKGAFEANMLNGFSEFENSAKMDRMVELLKKWREENPDDKTIIYSQWTSCMTYLQAALEREMMRSFRYDGTMTREDKNDIIKRFKKKGGPSILLVSLKCGGVGLNLVEANRVINFDPAWNYATESQAYDRVHRIGQQKDVFVKRLIVRDSIEQRILDIQKGKNDLANAALGEGDGGPIGRLGIRDILKLFGMRG